VASPLSLPTCRRLPTHPQHVCTASRLPCLLQTCTFVLGPLGCAVAHLERQGSREAAHTRPLGRARAPQLGLGSPVSPVGRACAPRMAGAPKCTWRRISSQRLISHVIAAACTDSAPKTPLVLIWTHHLEDLAKTGCHVLNAFQMGQQPVSVSADHRIRKFSDLTRK